MRSFAPEAINRDRFCGHTLRSLGAETRGRWVSLACETESYRPPFDLWWNPFLSEFSILEVMGFDRSEDARMLCGRSEGF
jgi:hypothetical protein